MVVITVITVCSQDDDWSDSGPQPLQEYFHGASTAVTARNTIH